MFRLVCGYKIISLLQLQNLIEDLVELANHTAFLSCDLLRLLCKVLRCERPGCYNWDDPTWRKLDQNGDEILFPKSSASSFGSTDKCSDISSIQDDSIESLFPTKDDHVKYGGEMLQCAFHTGIGYKRVLAANSIDAAFKEALLGRTDSHNSEGNIPQAMVAKIPQGHVFCPGTFSHWQTTDQHLFHFLCDKVAKKSTHKSDNLCQAWSHKMTAILNGLGIHTPLELHHDLCCVPSCTHRTPCFNDADRTAVLLAFWQVEELQFFNLSYFTKESVFDWNKEDNAVRQDTDTNTEDETPTKTSCLKCVYQPPLHDIPLCVYCHRDTQKEMDKHFCQRQHA